MHDPYNTTERGAGYYQQHPVTPPPPSQWTPERHRKPWPFFAFIAIIVFAVSFVVTVGWPSYWSSVYHTRETSTSSVDTAIDSPDFGTFVDSFSMALSQRRMPLIKSHTNEKEFAEYCIMADGSCTNSWQATYDQISVNKVQFIIPQTPTVNDITPGTICAFLPINSVSQYVIGLYIQNAGLIVPQSGNALYAFEQQNPPRGIWKWHAVYLNQGQC